MSVKIGGDCIHVYIVDVVAIQIDAHGIVKCEMIPGAPFKDHVFIPVVLLKHIAMHYGIGITANDYFAHIHTDLLLKDHQGVSVFQNDKFMFIRFISMSARIDVNNIQTIVQNGVVFGFKKENRKIDSDIFFSI